MKSTTLVSVALVFLLGVSTSALAQYGAPPPEPSGVILPPAQLDELTGPIALYPDPLVAQILPAATQPSQIVLADNYIIQGGDPNAIDQQPWDSSVKALARYPDVLHQLDSNLQWTVQLGQAFLNQPGDVMDSIQRLRAEAQAQGNLQTTSEQTVDTDDGEIEIIPTNPDYIYVPMYNPGLIFYAPGFGITFGPAFRFGFWLNHDFDWRSHHVIFWDRDHPRPRNWWHEPPRERHEAMNHGQVWHPSEQRETRGAVFDRGDRGYATPARASEPAREAPREHVAPTAHETPRAPVAQPGHEAPHAPVAPPAHEVPRQPARETRPAPNPVQVHTVPSRPTVSAFENVQNPRETRIDSARGAASRGTFGGGQISRPAPAPAPASRPAPSAPVSRPSSGGGGGGRPDRPR